MKTLKNMKDNFIQMQKLNTTLDSICDLQSVTKNELIISQANSLCNTIVEECKKVEQNFESDNKIMTHATYHKLINNKKVIYKITDRLIWFRGLELTNIETNEKIKVSWEKFFRDYIPLAE